MPFSGLRGRIRLPLRFVFISCLALFFGILPLFAQRPYPPRETSDSVSPGGNWREFDSEDRMTAARRVRFELLSDNNLRENRAVQSRIEIFCDNGKFKGSDFTPGISLGPPTHPGFWGQPKMEVMVRVDNKHGNRGWNWNGRTLEMDKNTTRELIGAQIFRIEFLGRGGPEIAEFSPAGLELSRISHACDLTPKKP